MLKQCSYRRSTMGNKKTIDGSSSQHSRIKGARANREVASGFHTNLMSIQENPSCGLQRTGWTKSSDARHKIWAFRKIDNMEAKPNDVTRHASYEVHSLYLITPSWRSLSQLHFVRAREGIVKHIPVSTNKRRRSWIVASLLFIINLRKITSIGVWLYFGRRSRAQAVARWEPSNLSSGKLWLWNDNLTTKFQSISRCVEFISGLPLVDIGMWMRALPSHHVCLLPTAYTKIRWSSVSCGIRRFRTASLC